MEFHFLEYENLQTTGDLSLDGCLYINKETHSGLLKRSQVAEGDLLIKNYRCRSDGDSFCCT